jgi:hypothetical protein
MNDDNRMTINWIKIGIICGFLVSFVYPSLQFVSNLVVGVILAVLMGLLLSLASVGLYYFVAIHKKTIKIIIALFSNIIAGTLLIQMFLVQLAIKSSKPVLIDESSKWNWSSLNHIHYGLDVAWDVYIFLGTLMFAICAYHHPKLGKIFSITGIAIALLMITSNISVFPNPPASSGLIDFGPFIGLWYLAVTIKILFSYKWVKQNLV